MPVLFKKAKTDHGVELIEPCGRVTRYKTVTENGKTFTRAWSGNSIVDIPPPNSNGVVDYKIEAPEEIKVDRF